MKFIRSLPLMWANTRCPFSSSTANIVFGSGSMTVPSTSIASFFATGFVFPFLSCRVPVGGPAHERAAYQSGAESATGLYRGQDLRAMLGDRDRVFEMGRQRAIEGHHGPIVLEHGGLIRAER